VVGLPLIFSMISQTIMQFTDRIFLGNYSLDAIAASMPAGIASFLFLSFFMGVTEYVSVFVAQYTGAKAPWRVGAAVWQGLYFCFIAAFALASLIFAAEWIFSLAGHAPAVRELEVTYFRILCAGGGFALISVCLSTFYSGRGLTWPVAVINAIGALVNIPLDYALINGKWGLPEMGIAGAGIATVAGAFVTMVLFAIVVFSKRNAIDFGLRANWRFERELFTRFLRFGLPGGVQFFLDMFGVTFFIFMVGRLGKAELAATNIVISIELLAFLPLIGLSIATSVLVGQSIGAGKPDEGERAASSANHIGLFLMGLATLAFLFLPEQLLGLFRTRDVSVAEFSEVVGYGMILLRIVSLYLLVDVPVLIWIGGLKGAGDIRFVMWMIAASSFSMLVVPSYVLINYFDSGLYGPWGFFTGYVFMLFIIAGMRFKGGKWKAMSVIEPAPTCGHDLSY
jgi:MATE family multidrug resistance protein